MRSHHSSSRQPEINTATHNFRNASPKATFYIPHIAPTSVSHHGTPQNNTAQTFYLGHESRGADMNVNLQLFNANDKSAGSQRGLRQHKRNYSDSTNNNSLVNRLADYSHRVLPENSQEARSRRHQDHGTLDDHALKQRQFPQNVEDKNSHQRHVEYNSGRNPVKPVLNIDFSSVINKHHEEVPLDHHKLNKSSHGSKVSLTHDLDKENQPVKANKSSSHDHAKAASKLYKTTNPSSILPKYGDSSYTTSIPKRDSYINDYEIAYSSPHNQLSSYMSNSTRMNEVKASGSQQLTSDIRSTSRASMLRADDMGQLLSQDKSDTTAKRSQNSDSYSFKDIKKHVANYGMPVKIGLDLAGYANSSNQNDVYHHDKSSQNKNIGEGFENDMSLVNFGTDADIVPQPVQIVPQLKSSTNKVSVYSSLHGHEDSQTKDSLSAFDKTGYIARHSHLSMNNRRSDQSDEKFNATAPHSRAVHSKRERDEHPKRHQEEVHMEVERYRKDLDGRKSDPVKAEKKLHDLLNPSRRHDERNSSGSRHKRSKSTTAKLRSHSKIVNQKKSFAEDFFVSLVERNKSAGYEGECIDGSRDSLKLTPIKDELILAALHENRDRTKSKGRSDELIQISHILQHASTPEYTKGGDMRHNITSSSRHHHHAHKDQLLSGSSSIKGDRTMDAIFKRDESGTTKSSHQEMKESYKKSMRSHERHSHAQAQTDKGNLKRIASQPEELKKFAMQLVRDKMQENKKDKPATPVDSKQKYETDKLRKQSRDFQDRSTPQSVKHAKAVPFALFDLGRKEKEEPKEDVRLNKHAGIETYSIVDKNSEERNRYRSREDKSKDKDRKSQEAGMSKTYKKDMQLENVSKAAYASVGSSKREVKMSPRVRQENNYTSKYDSASHASHSKKEMSDSRKGPVDSTRDKENLYRYSKTDSVHKKSKDGRKSGERSNKRKEEPLMPTNISYLLSSEHNTSMGNLFNCEATILDKNPLSEFTETEDLPSKWLGDKLLVPELEDHLYKPKQAMTPSASQAKIASHHTKQKSLGDHVALQKHSTRETKGGRYSYQDPETSNRREESGSQTRHVEPRVIDTQAPVRPVIVKDGWLGGPIGAEETPRYQASQRERHEEKMNNHYANSYDKQYASAGAYKEVSKSNKGTPKVDMLSQIAKNTRDQKPGMPPKSGQNQASQANISCAMDYQSNDVYVARREKDNELAKKFDEFKAKEMSNHAGLKERRTSREEKANKYGGVGKHGLQELNSYDSTPFLLANLDNYMSTTSQREHLVMTGRTVPHVASHQGTVQKRPNYQLQIPSAERYLDAGVTGKRDAHVKPHMEHEKLVREESKSGYTQTTRYKPEGDLFDDSFLQHSFKPTSKDFDGPTSNMPSHRKEDLLDDICHLSAIHPLSDEDHIEISDKRPESRYTSKERKVESRKPKQIEVLNPSHESYSQQSRRKESEKYIDVVRLTSPKETAGVFAKPMDRHNEVLVVPKITDRLDDKLSPKVRLFDNFSGGTLREKRIPQYEKAQKAMHISAVSTPKDAEGSMRRERFIKDKTGLDVFTIGRVGASTGRNRSRHEISIKSPMGMSGKDSILYDQSNHSQTQKNSSVVKKNSVGFSRPSNKQMIKNAMNHVCLAGEVNRREREEVQTRIDEDKDRNNFIIVFKDLSGRQDLRALYSFDTTSGFTRKLYANGSAPVQLEESLISAYYRYDSGAREFKLIPDNKTLSIVVDAVSLHPYMSRKISQ